MAAAAAAALAAMWSLVAALGVAVRRGSRGRCRRWYQHRWRFGQSKQRAVEARETCPICLDVGAAGVSLALWTCRLL